MSETVDRWARKTGEDRALYEATSQEGRDWAWNALAPDVAKMLRPFRFDGALYPCALFPIADDYTAIDIDLIRHTAGDNLKLAKEFVRSELIAHCEALFR